MYLIFPSGDLQRTRAFYDVLGVSMVEEQHGSGPVHFAFRDQGLGSAEIYPMRPLYRDHAVVLGFHVAGGTLTEVTERLVVCGGIVFDEAKDTSQGWRVRLEDPDGRLVEVFEETDFRAD